jgi:hypothetical protein
MISRNLSHDSKVWTQEFDLQGRPLTARIGHFTTEDDLRKRGLKYGSSSSTRINTTPRLSSSAKVNRLDAAAFSRGYRQEGHLPSILETLRARKETKSKSQVGSRSILKTFVDKRQLGYKRQFSVWAMRRKTSTFYGKDIAAATTNGQGDADRHRNFIEKDSRT